MRTESKIKFVGLHAHSVAGSIFDAIGYPDQHMDFAYDNGCEALALTDHGNMNGMAYQVLHAKKMKKAGKDFKPIFGCEAYFIPSISEWLEEYDQVMKDKKKARRAKKDSASASTVEDEGASKKRQDILRRRRHLVLLAQNQTGLSNIFKLITESYKPENFYRYPRIDYALLEKYGEGIIASSACLGGVYAGCYWENHEEGPEAIREAMRAVTRRMISIFGDRWYGELQWNNVPQQHELNKYILEMREEFGINIVSTADSHYPNPDAWKDRELYKRLGWLGKKPDWADGSELPEGVEEIGYELYPKNGDQMWQSYKEYSKECGATYDETLVLQSIEESHRIAFDRIESFMPDNSVKLPNFVVPDGMTADQALIRQCVQGMKAKGFADNQEYIERLKHEIEVISGRGFSKYFLTMKAISDIANDMMLTGTGRGSAAGSLVAYVLEITQIDPIKYGLLFSRFLRSDATDYPDIDYDVSDSMGLKEKLVELWGDDCVAPISNWNTLQLRSLIKDISKFYGIPFTEVNSVTSVMMAEATPKAKAKLGMKAGMYVPTWEETLEFSESLQNFLEEYPQVEAHVKGLVGQVRSCSRHAGGVVIAEGLDKNMPLINSGGVMQSPWAEGQNVRHLEPMGFIKFDLLGLATLAMFETAIYHILKRHKGIENPTFEQIKHFYDNEMHPDVMDLEDQKVYENVFHKGKWAGVFQFTSPGAQQFTKQVKPRNIIDISSITSIYRPGPLSANVHEEFVEAKERPQYIKYLTDEVRDITEETFGFLIFQEQIAKIAHSLGKDLTLDEGNLLRKVLTKKGTGKGHEVKEGIHKKFIAGCKDKGIQESKCQALWDKFEFFSGYGFNKSHAVCYSIISYQCAWLLTYYEPEWLAAFLDKEPEKRKETAISLAKSFGYNIAPLDINKSGRVWEISEDSKTLIQPLTDVKGFGDSALIQVTNNRPFHNAEDLLFREEVVYSKLNKRCLDALCRAGALDNLVDNQFTGRKHFWSACIVDRPKTKAALRRNIEKYKDEGDFSEEEIIEFKTKLTGVYPLNLVISPQTVIDLGEKGIPPVSEFDALVPVCWFVVKQINEKKTRTDKLYWEVVVTDSNNKDNKIKCWGIRPTDKLLTNRVYMARLQHDKWGFSTRSISRSFRLLG
jgi:DNA polymerase-3 subunit alpha